MTAAPLALVCNFDAELELLAPERPRSGRAVQALAARAPAFAAAVSVWLRRPVLPIVPGEHVGAARARRLRACPQALCWCPTPRALAALAGLGLPVPAAPPLAVLQRANHRRFAFGLVPPLPGARWVEDLAALDALLAGPPPPGGAGWLLRRAFGFSGRMARRIPHAPLAAAARTWAKASMAHGGLQVDPFHDVADAPALHGWIAADGALVLGRPTRQVVDSGGAWLASAAADDLPAEVVDELRQTATVAARALVDLGYHGPFGIDALCWRDGDRVRLHPLSDLNARLCMGTPIGLAGCGPRECSDR